MSDKMVKHDSAGKTGSVLKGVGIGAVGAVAILSIGLLPSLIVGGVFIGWRVLKK